jgi:hypothetical protein
MLARENGYIWVFDAINYQGHRLTKLYESWANDPLVDFIVLKVSICFSVLVLRNCVFCFTATPQPLNHSVLSFL